MALLELNRAQEAQEEFQKVKEIDSGYVDAYVGMARVAAKLGDGETAKRRIEQAVATGLTVREIQAAPSLVKYLTEDLEFLLRLWEKEAQFKIVARRDPFQCPIKKAHPHVGDGTSSSKYPRKDQMLALKRVRIEVDRLKRALTGKDLQTALDAWRSAEEQYKKAQKVVSDADLAADLSETWQSLQKLGPQIQKLKELALKQAVDECIKGISRVYQDVIRPDMTRQERLERLADAKPYDEKLKRTLLEAKEGAHGRMLALVKDAEQRRKLAWSNIEAQKEFYTKVWPRLRLTGIIEGTVMQEGEEKILPPNVFMEIDHKTVTIPERAPVPGVERLTLQRVDRFERRVEMIYRSQPVYLRMKEGAGNVEKKP